MLIKYDVHKLKHVRTLCFSLAQITNTGLSPRRPLFMSLVFTCLSPSLPLPPQVFGAPMGPGDSSGSHMMPGGGPGMGPQYMGQSYGDAMSKGYGQPVMYGRPGGAYNPASGYGGRYVAT